jgi:hypothetical protein
MPYTPAAISAALSASARTWDFRYERLDLSATLVVPIDVTGASVANAALAEKMKRTFRGSLSPDAGFDYASDRLRVYARLLMPDGGWNEWPLGTFLLSTSETARRSTTPRETVPVSGFDLLQVLEEDSVTDRYVVAAGANYVTAIATVLASAGFPTHLVVDTAKTLPAPLEWEPGVAKLKIVNDLLAAVGYTSLSMDALGVPEAAPYEAPDVAPLLWSYALDTASLVRPGTVSQLDLFNVPNVIVGVVSQPDRPTLRSVATNTDPTSPLSTVRRGRNIVKILDPQLVANAVDQATLDAIVARALAETTQQYETVEFSTGIMPIHGDGDVVTFDYGSGVNRYRETSWEIDLRAGGVMKHSARRVVLVG